MSGSNFMILNGVLQGGTRGGGSGTTTYPLAIGVGMTQNGSAFDGGTSGK